jgi:tetratricopeptide (TPR) repeat protein
MAPSGAGETFPAGGSRIRFVLVPRQRLVADSHPAPDFPNFPGAPGAAVDRFLRVALLLGLVCGSFPLAVNSSASGQTAVTSPTPASAPAVATPPSPSSASPPAAPLSPSPLGEALILYRKGDFDGAIRDYQQVLQETPASAEAYAGLTRVYLKKKDVQQASDTIHKALQVADGPAVHVALGEVYFRQGKISDAEVEWVKVINSGHADARAYLGLARVRWAISNYKSGWAMIDRAHALDPSDPEILRVWVGKLSRDERTKFLENYLASENNDDEESRTAMRHYLEYIKARAKDPRSACHLVSKTTATETSMAELLEDAQHLRGLGLTVEVNGRKSRLLLDTGASGILINRPLAEKAGVTRLSNVDIGGVGDKGSKSGYRALADSLKIGGLEFQNCPVEVLDQRSVIGEDGLIGADVFSSFLVDLDFPSEKLRLSPLPKRPEETAATINLKTEEDDDSEPDSQSSDGEVTGKKPDGSKPAPGPQDRYIAPEMQSYTRVFRFGHMLLVPTSIGDVPAKLFLLDSGALMNHITPAAAREITKVHGDSDTIVKGLSGSVKSVYRADNAVLQFGHLRQKNQDLISFDLSHISDDMGTEISGTLGFVVLRLLDIKIDYRDGLVDFSYDPKRWGQ